MSTFQNSGSAAVNASNWNAYDAEKVDQHRAIQHFLSATIGSFSVISVPSHPDVLVPQLRFGLDELLHHLHALRQVQVDHFHAVTFHECACT